MPPLAATHFLLGGGPFRGDQHHDHHEQQQYDHSPSSPSPVTTKSKRIRRRVTFQDYPPVVYHVPKWTTLVDASDVWYTPDEYECFKMRDWMLARRFVHDRPSRGISSTAPSTAPTAAAATTTTTNQLLRGLEWYLVSDTTLRRRQRAQQAVFEAQQSRSCHGAGRTTAMAAEYSQQIADVYARITMPAVSAARAMGELDARVAAEGCSNEYYCANNNGSNSKILTTTRAPKLSSSSMHASSPSRNHIGPLQSYSSFLASSAAGIDVWEQYLNWECEEPLVMCDFPMRIIPLAD